MNIFLSTATRFLFVGGSCDSPSAPKYMEVNNLDSSSNKAFEAEHLGALKNCYFLHPQKEVFLKLNTST